MIVGNTIASLAPHIYLLVSKMQAKWHTVHAALVQNNCVVDVFIRKQYVRRNKTAEASTSD